nr:uncharacterized protein LOC127347195 [Lolium perenne]
MARPCPWYLAGTAGPSGFGSRTTAEEATDGAGDLSHVGDPGGERRGCSANRGARMVLPARNPRQPRTPARASSPSSAPPRTPAASWCRAHDDQGRRLLGERHGGRHARRGESWRGRGHEHARGRRAPPPPVSARAAPLVQALWPTRPAPRRPAPLVPVPVRGRRGRPDGGAARASPRARPRPPPRPRSMPPASLQARSGRCPVRHRRRGSKLAGGTELVSPSATSGGCEKKGDGGDRCLRE